MYYKIENEFLTCEIDDMGAQLHSLILKENSKEYIWQGNPDIWYGQAPVLFPIIGQLLDDKYRYNGTEYTMPKHGLARKLLFNVKECEGAKAVFSLESDEKTRENYPFDFEYLVTFELCGKKLVNTMTVVNKTDGEMYFSVGAHPAFNCKVGDIIEFEQPETLATERIDKDSIIIDEKYPLIENSREIAITKEIFEPDALILSDIKSKKLRIKSDYEVEFTFGDCPFLGIWAKPGAPYVCIEPWYGVNDGRDVKADISEKRGIQHLNKGETFEFAWSAEVI
ncbi:MAG: aldose 1-epimerase family protein [Ruminococcaceae bacterium]|nr:aldose 1-epimerase family protein [Oscillospiraceae bacterium]